ncbi:hypothetical protein [Metabacillus litoralis]|uniref:hypothetical protein n=1 Tax=Metabacillus litoralis TaxID=152268 RepID=UPI0020419A57|nr:hypothetical protein [Metabacillus litoralis]MCM3161013.1 hypothetical protein [Metabacillus litoralis]
MEQLENKSNPNRHLQSQISLYSVDTTAFMNEEESRYNRSVIKFKYYIEKVTKVINELKLYSKYIHELVKLESDPYHYGNTPEEMLKVINTKQFKSKLNKLNDLRFSHYEDEFVKIMKFYKDVILNKISNYEDKITTGKKYRRFHTKAKSIIEMDNTRKLNIINEFVLVLKRKVESEKIKVENCSQHLTDEKLRRKKDDPLRELNPISLTSKRKISQFQSTLTRTLKVKTDTTTTDIFVVRAYRYAIFEDLVKRGFRYLGEEYQYFSSTAGGIRTKKSVFIKKSVWEKYKNKLMCGLTIEEINRQGGMNTNKFQAYLSLCMTSSVPWTKTEGFDIDKCIVVEDLKTVVHGEVDHINDKYEINRINKGVEINHTDGCGMILPSVSDKSFMFRMPFFKGLLVSFDYVDFIKKHKDASPIVEDIYGKKWNVIKDGISIIFTKSQFKAWSFWNTGEDGWLKYKKDFILHGCEAVKCKEEDEVFNDKRLSYQMLQTLYKMDRSSLEKLCETTIKEIESIGSDEKAALKLLGADPENENKFGYQRVLEMMPEMLNETYTREQIKEYRRSLIKEAKSGHILLPGSKRTYIAPDLYAFCERLFLKKEDPKGLLQNGEVSCALFEDGQKLDALRSPHLFLEHSIERNKINKKTKEWFITNDIHMSVKSLNSKLLMYDVDGDDCLIICNPDYLRIAEEHMKGIVPLDYELGKAEAQEINYENIYESLTKAYEKNIGEISNAISICFNKGKDKVDLDVIRWLVYENNSIIDYAKTLWFPERPKGEVERKIKEATRGKLPFYFHYVKDKPKKSVAPRNDSAVNMLDTIIPNNNIQFEGYEGEFDYTKLMKNKNIKLDQTIIDKYEELNSSKFKEIKNQLKEKEGSKRKQIELQVYKDIRKELFSLGKKDDVIDVLIKYLYEVKDSKNKQTLWYAFGNYIARNVEFNVKGIKRCNRCYVEIERKQKKSYCEACAEERKREQKKQWKEKNKGGKIKAS